MDKNYKLLYYGGKIIIRSEKGLTQQKKLVISIHYPHTSIYKYGDNKLKHSFKST